MADSDPDLDWGSEDLVLAYIAETEQIAIQPSASPGQGVKRARTRSVDGKGDAGMGMGTKKEAVVVLEDTDNEEEENQHMRKRSKVGVGEEKKPAGSSNNTSSRALRPRPSPSQVIDISDSPPIASTSTLPSHLSFPAKVKPSPIPQSKAVPVLTSSPSSSSATSRPQPKLSVSDIIHIQTHRSLADQERRKGEQNKRTRLKQQKLRVEAVEGDAGEEEVEDGPSNRKKEITKHLLATLKDGSNPITHSDLYGRTQHVISASTGHQVSNRAGGTRDGVTAGNYFKSRNMKLKHQFMAQVSDGLRVAEGSSSLSLRTKSGVKTEEGDGIKEEEQKHPVESKNGPVTNKPGLGGIGIGGRFSAEMAKRREEVKLEGASESQVEKLDGFVKKSSIFAGLTFYLNGYSGPRISDLELKRLLAVHGGNVSYHPTSNCTHILVVNNLSASKAQKFLDSAGSTRGKKCKVVHVDWVLDSVEQGKRLGELKYNVINSRVQPTLMTSWTAKGKANVEEK